MPKSRRARFVALVDLLARRRVDVDPAAFTEGRVLVDGRAVTNPAARVRLDASVRVVPTRRLRGDIKLSHALEVFDIAVAGRIALDVGASAGGFTTALVDRGARRVYALDAGVGQLVGRLRQDERVVDLEGHNIGALDTTIVPERVEVVTMDLSYLALAEAIAHVGRIDLAEGVDLVTLVKPTFELHRATLAATDTDITDAVERVAKAMTAHRWRVVASCPAPRTGRRGAREVFLHGRRHGTDPFW
jgi:23S rRNA (cytidine1920-2'-O)/16S rRNA (cytidine1409-2'-O)-methyltransferase